MPAKKAVVVAVLRIRNGCLVVVKVEGMEGRNFIFMCFFFLRGDGGSGEIKAVSRI